MKNPFLKYKNPDDRCTYPFTPDPVGYCWSFANHVDGTDGFADISSICMGCEMFKDSPNYDPDADIEW